MSSEIKTILVNDPRISRITSDIHVAVKEGPASCVVQGYKTNSNSNSTTLFNVNVPSENTLVDRNLRVQATLKLVLDLTMKADTTTDAFFIVPAAFPLNQALQSASLTLNNAKVSVQSADVLNVFTKQFDQKFLSKHIQTTPSYVDKYFGLAVDGLNGSFNSAWGGGIENAEKDSDTSGRSDCELTYTLYKYVDTALTAMTANEAMTSGSQYVCEVSLIVNEPILGMPALEFKEDEANFMGMNSLELVLQYNNFHNVFNCAQDCIVNVTPGTRFGNSTSSLFMTDDAKLMTRQMSLHPSQYAKLSAKNVLPFDELVAYKSTIATLNEGVATVQGVQTQVISMRQIPDKIYILMRPTYNSQKPIYSNNLVLPITGVNIVFNNKAGLLSEMSQTDLYQMSRRNGSQQSWNEFRGTVSAGIGYNKKYCGIGGIVVIDPVRDLGLDDILSSGSLGQFGFQAIVSGKTLVEHDIANADLGTLELVVIASYGGCIITQQGSSATMSGLLTKSSVLEAKESGKGAIDYETLEEMSGGNLAKKGITAIGNLLMKNRGKIGKAVGEKISGSGAYQQSGGSKLSKYM
jgi:hypothetical protein